MSNSKWTPPDDIGREVSKIFQEFPDVSGRQFGELVACRYCWEWGTVAF